MSQSNFFLVYPKDVEAIKKERKFIVLFDQETYNKLEKTFDVGELIEIPEIETDPISLFLNALLGEIDRDIYIKKYKEGLYIMFSGFSEEEALKITDAFLK